MRVLMTTNTLGGTWTSTRELASELSRRGLEVLVAGLGARAGAAELAELDRAGVAFVHRPYRLEWMRDPWDDLERTRDWLRELETCWRPDVAQLNTFGAGNPGWSLPTLVAGHCCVRSWWRAVRGRDCPESWAGYSRRVRESLRAASVVAAPSAWMLAQLERHYGPFTAARVLPCGRRRPALAPRRKRPFILGVGRLWDEAKNLQALDEAARDLHWPVLLAGPVTGPDGMPRTPKHALPLGILPPARMWRWMQRASIFALPARYEPFSLAALEAAQCGSALLLGDAPALRELWEDAALFVAPDDGAALRDGLRRLASDRALRVRLAERAWRRAQELTTERMADGYEQVYAELLCSRAAARRVSPAPNAPDASLPLAARLSTAAGGTFRAAASAHASP